MVVITLAISRKPRFLINNIKHRSEHFMKTINVFYVQCHTDYFEYWTYNLVINPVPDFHVPSSWLLFLASLGVLSLLARDKIYYKV